MAVKPSSDRGRQAAEREVRTNVLVIEDNRRHAELMRDVLEDSGLTAVVECAYTGKDALESLASKPVDLVILDYRLPDTDGIEVMRELQRRRIRVPTIFVTTAESIELAVQAMKLGAEDFLQKQEGYLEVLPLLVREAFERQRLRHERERLALQLRQAEKLASLGILAAGLAHNINNRLTSLKTFLDLVPLRHDDEYFRTEFRKTCQTDLDKIALLVHELTRYAFSDNAPLPPQPISELAMQAVEHLDDQIQRKRIELVTEFGPVPRIPLDPEGVKQLFINLLKNAIQASPAGGRIRLLLSSAGDEIVVRVEDEGPGLPDEMIDKVFDPFFTTKDQGLGIGLYLCHKIASLHGGRIEPGNRPEGGAVFTVHFPLRPADAEAASAPAV